MWERLSSSGSAQNWFNHSEINNFTDHHAFILSNTHINLKINDRRRFKLTAQVFNKLERRLKYSSKLKTYLLDSAQLNISVLWMFAKVLWLEFSVLLGWFLTGPCVSSPFFSVNLIQQTPLKVCYEGKLYTMNLRVYCGHYAGETPTHTSTGRASDEHKRTVNSHSIWTLFCFNWPGLSAWRAFSAAFRALTGQ